MTSVGRKQGLSTITINIMQQLGLYQMLSQANVLKLTLFLGRIYSGYKRDVEYHNDIHGADVLQMMFVFLKEGDLSGIAELNQLDLLSLIISCVCHDFAHDGLNNAYHVNAISPKAIRYNDISV